MSHKKISEILKLVEFLNEEVKEVSKRLSRVTPKEVSEKFGGVSPAQRKDPQSSSRYSPRIREKAF